LEVVGLGAAGGNAFDGAAVAAASGVRVGARISPPFDGEPLLLRFVLYLLFGDPFALDFFDW
jgi:hypothetical protein